MTKSWTLLLIFILGGLITAIGFLQWRTASQNELSAGSSLLFHDLQKVLPKITSVHLQQGSQHIHLQKTDNGWNVREKNNYPADASLVRQLLITLAEAKQLEPKTSNPKQYYKIGVLDPNAPAGGQWVEVFTDTTPVASLIVGKNKLGSQNGATYVRRPKEAESWLVSGVLRFDANPSRWLDRTLLSLAPHDLQTVTLTTSDKNTWVFAKETTKDLDTFKVVSAPKVKTKANDKASLPAPNTTLIAGALQHLRFDNVDALQASDVRLKNAKLHSLAAQTTDNRQVIINLYEAGERFFITLTTNGMANSKHLENWLYEIPSYRGHAMLGRS